MTIYDHRGEGRSADKQAHLNYAEAFEDLNSIYAPFLSKMNKEITIRAALCEDLSQLVHLAKQLSETVVISESYVSENFQHFVESEQHCLLVAIQGAAVVGYASGYFHHAIYAGGLVAFVDEIVVDASYRSMKIGSSLMKHFEQVSVEKDCRIVTLATFGAKSFYEKLGYSSRAGYFKKYLQ